MLTIVKTLLCEKNLTINSRKRPMQLNKKSYCPSDLLIIWYDEIAGPAGEKTALSLIHPTRD